MIMAANRWAGAFLLGCFVVALCGCNPSNSTGGPSLPDPNVHMGDVDGYRYELHGDSVLNYQQLGENDRRVTSGSNWLEVKAGELIANGKEYGPVNRGDMIVLDAQGQVFVNNRKR